MKPSYSPTRVTIDADSGRPHFDDDGEVVLRALSLSPGASRRPFDVTPAPSSCTILHLLLQGAVHAVLSGAVVSIVLCPVMIGFASMIFSHPDFSDTLPMLTKLVFASSTMHQLIITSLSPLPFAIGQVQDTGMIFLASMASSIMTELSAVPLAERIATVLVQLSISTVLVGVGLILTGKARLASLVQYLPTPVIGGYLAYVGFFMVKGGVSLTTGVSLASVHGWGVLVTSSHSLLLLAPGLAGGVMLSILTSRFRHFAVFPCCILILPASFFFAVWISSYTLDDARAAGFLEDNGTGVPVMKVYDLFDFNHIHWSVMPAQIPTMLSMFVMIAFASSLDIASICMGTTSSMNYNAQLQTVGMSNLVSGLTGGYTGSYIFSQTVFTSRFRPTAAAESRFPGITRLVGVTLAVCEFAIVMTPISLMAIVPKFLFGAVMIFIGIDLLKTWLVGVFHKLLFAEYLTVVGTFCCLNIFGVQLGLATGITLAATSFLVEYAKAQDVRVVHKTSNVIRNADQHALLYGSSSVSCDADNNESRQQDAIVTIELQGHIFFGSATRIQNCVKSVVYVRTGSRDNAPRTTSIGNIRANEQSESWPLLPVRQETYAHVAMPDPLMNLHGELCTDPDRKPTQFVVLDFSRVSGMDATAARSCFLVLKLSFSLSKVCAVYCGMKPSVEFLLRANDVIPTYPTQEEEIGHYEIIRREGYVASDLDLALDWCEQQLILSAAKRRSIRSGKHLILSTLKSSALPLSQVFAAYLSDTRKSDPTTPQHLEALAQLFTVTEWSAQRCLFHIGERSSAWFVLLRGTIELLAIPTEAALPSYSPKSEQTESKRLQDSLHTLSNRENLPKAQKELVGRVRPGCIFGDMDFMLEQPRVMDATSTATDTLTASVTRKEMVGLRERQPELALLLQEILLRASYMTLAEKLHSLAV
ncbi:STAS domain-containing protein [Phytophthora infestans]|uniref:STAS domain-containing protein n=1 Tax=Phytophthora infestans TaxID=4787 RepID=A0A833W7C9_PHYIN|nr:STAS domain-containing protein [Phytophthora infestans]KAF4143703.1 STAS domain-containing protein [Phytophthora infestans]